MIAGDTGEYRYSHGSTRMKRKLDSNTSNNKSKYDDEERTESSESVRMIQSDVSSASSSARSSVESAVDNNTLLLVKDNHTSAPTSTVTVTDVFVNVDANEYALLLSCWR
jgi:hypothetical protein